jgi:H+/Cl- antiporter ClcA
VHHLEHLLWDDLPSAIGVSSPPWYLLLGLPVASGAIIARARRFLPGDGGHRPLAGLTGGHPVLAAAPGIALAAIGTLAYGIVLGPEGPLIALGSLVGLSVTVVTRLQTPEQRVVGWGRGGTR